MDRMPTKDLPDTTLDKEAAESQAQKIRNFWLARGEAVTVWVELDHRSGQPLPLYIVRSDITLTQRRA